MKGIIVKTQFYVFFFFLWGQPKWRAIGESVKSWKHCS